MGRPRRAGRHRRVRRLVPRPGGRPAITADVFGTAPRELVRAVSLQQTVDLVRTTIDVVEEHVDELASPERRAVAARGRAALLARDRLRRGPGLRPGRRGPRRLGRPARVARRRRPAARRGRRRRRLPRGRARAGARSRGVVRGHGPCAGRRPRDGRRGACSARPATTGSTCSPASRASASSSCSATSPTPPSRPARCSPSSRPGPSSSGPSCRALARRRPQRAGVARRACAPPWRWPDAPRPVLADDLLPERALAGDDDAVGAARRRGVPAAARRGPGPVETLRRTSSARRRSRRTARELFVHPNTVRYRLRRVADVTGLTPTIPAGRLVAAGRPRPGPPRPTDRTSP